MVTELLIGAGIALFIAILAWGNQIRSVQKDTREIERELIETKKLPWQDIRFLIRENCSPEDKIKALGNLMEKRKLKSRNIPELLKCFEKLNLSRKNLSNLNKEKYNLSIYLTISFLICGFLSFFSFEINLVNNFIVKSDMVYIMIPFIFMIFLFVKMHNSNKEEESFTSIIESIYNNLY